MTETALLCFFLYVPVLMMVIVWGDLSLDKERAHVATAYMAFRRQAVDDASLGQQFFPTATGQSDGTSTIRSVNVDADEAVEGPLYTLPSTTTGDYSARQDFDLQYKLFSLGIGEVSMSYELEAMPDGTVAFAAHWNQIKDDVVRYLVENEIVSVPDLPDEPIVVAAGQPIKIDTPTSSTAYTHYVKVLTDIFNGQWNAGGQTVGGMMGNVVPRFESSAGLTTTFESPFMSDLSRNASGEAWEGEVTDKTLQDPLQMHFGQTDMVPDDDSFRGGYAYLRNPLAVPNGSALRNDLYELSPTTFQYPADSPAVKIHEMAGPLSDDGGPDHLLYLTPGDPRPPQQ